MNAPINFVVAENNVSSNMKSNAKHSNNNQVKYNVYHANIKNRSAANATNVGEPMETNENFASFRKPDLLNLINKSILYFYKAKTKQLYRNINAHPLIAAILPSLKTVEYVKLEDGSLHYLIPLLPGTFMECKNGPKKCLDEADLSRISFHIRIIDEQIVVYVVYNEIAIGALTADSTFINSLNEKEQGFMRALFQNYDIIPPEGRSLESYSYFNGVNVWPYVVRPTRKTKTNKLRWNERVKVKEIPNKATVKAMSVVEGGRRSRKTKRVVGRTSKRTNKK